MKTIKHSLHFITELDETNPAAQQLLSLSKLDQVKILEAMLKELLVPAISKQIDELNAGNSYATLKVVA